MRVSELAKELGKTSKEVLDILQKQGHEVKSHSSSLSDEQAQAVKKAFAAPKPKAAPAPAAEGTAPAEPPKKKIVGGVPAAEFPDH